MKNRKIIKGKDWKNIKPGTSLGSQSLEKSLTTTSITQPNLIVLNKKEVRDAHSQIATLEARAKGRKIKYQEINDLTNEEKVKIMEKFEKVQPMYREIDRILPYFWNYTKSLQGTCRLIGIKYIVKDQLEVLPNKFLLRPKVVDSLLQQLHKYFLLIAKRRKIINAMKFKKRMRFVLLKQQDLWRKAGFDHQEISEWKKIGLKLGEHDLANYLRKEKKLNPNEIGSKLEELRKEYEEYKLAWKDLRQDFTLELKEQWESKGFNYDQVKQWIDVVGIDESDYAQWLKVIKERDVKWISTYGDKQKLKEEYEKFLLEVKSGHKINTDTIQKIKKITPEEKALIEQLIPDRKLREKYQKWGLCKKCSQFNDKQDWCKFCDSSGNPEVDNFLQNYFELMKSNNNKKFPKLWVLKWIPYEQFADIKYLAEGGFGKVYKAKWVNGHIFYWNIRSCKKEDNKETYIPAMVALKSLNNSQKITKSFLREFINNTIVNYVNEYIDKNSQKYVVNCYGISQEPITNNYVMVMDYIENGNLREYLKTHHNNLDFSDRLIRLSYIAVGLNSIHNKGLTHRDFHPGNILVFNYYMSYIADLGLSRPVNEEEKEEEICEYGVLPYIAPEVLNKNPYTPAADIYSFGIVAYEMFSCFPPYHQYAHDVALAALICEGLRPKFQIKVPLLLKKTIERCWDADPTKRPTAGELSNTFSNWLTKQQLADWRKSLKKGTEFYLQYKEIVEEFSRALSASAHTNFDYKLHPKAFYTSRLLDFRDLSRPKNSKEVNDWFYSRSTSTNLDFNTEAETKKNNYQTKEFEFDIETPSSIRDLVKRICSMEETKSVKLDKMIDEEFTFSQKWECPIMNYWQGVHCNFTLELVQEWMNHGFTIEQCHEWMSTNSLSQQEREIHKPTYYSWLRDYKHLTPEQMLNHHNEQELREKYQTYQEQLAQIEQSPK